VTPKVLITLAIPSTQTTVEPKQQQAKAEYHSSGASNREIRLQEGHDFQPGNRLLLLGKSDSRAGQPRGRVAQAVRWHEQPRGREEGLPCVSLQRCCALGTGVLAVPGQRAVGS